MQSRFEALDAWRGICALMVVFYHFRAASHIRELPLVLGSWRFVDFFFVLSGFIIAHAYGSRLGTREEVKTFAVRRFFRLWPVHAFILAGLVTLEAVRFFALGGGFNDSTDPATILPNLLLVHAWGMLPDTTWNGPSWSISAEVAAYAIFAGLCLIGRPRSGAAILLVASLLVMLFVAPKGMRSDYDFAVVRCLYGFAAGVLVHALWTRWPFRWRFAGAAELGTVLLSVAAVSFLGLGASATLVVPAFALLVYVFASERGPLSRALHAAPLQYLGERSYSIYMVHVPIWYAIRVLGEQAGLVEQINGLPVLVLDPFLLDVLTFAFVVVVLAVAEAVYRMVERPGRRFTLRRAASAAW